jgi:hypothetical protein
VESRWRGRVEHVQSGRQSGFLEIGDLLSFFKAFGIGEAASPAGNSAETPEPMMDRMGGIDRP